MSTNYKFQIWLLLLWTVVLKQYLLIFIQFFSLNCFNISYCLEFSLNCFNVSYCLENFIGLRLYFIFYCEQFSDLFDKLKAQTLFSIKDLVVLYSLFGLTLQKFRRFSVESNLIARLQAKYNSIQKALGEGGHNLGTHRYALNTNHFVQIVIIT